MQWRMQRRGTVVASGRHSERAARLRMGSVECRSQKVPSLVTASASGRFLTRTGNRVV